VTEASEIGAFRASVLLLSCETMVTDRANDSHTGGSLNRGTWDRGVWGKGGARLPARTTYKLKSTRWVRQ
jgi:hypothetical protein